MNLRSNLEVQGVVQNWVAQMMSQYSISAEVMDSALNKVILQLKDQIMSDLLVEIAQQEEANSTPTQMQEAPQEMEVDNGGYGTGEFAADTDRESD